MRFSLAVLFAASTTLVGGVLTGCPSDDDGDSCKEYTPPAGFDPMTPTVQFTRDVMPIFGPSCAFTSCHGNESGGANGVFLGGNDAKKIRQGLVDVRSSELLSMALVKPGAPAESYLMQKLDGTQCRFDAQCTGGSCKDSMPRFEPQLPTETRDKVRRWIAQGAKDD